MRQVYLDFFSVAQGGGDIKSEKHQYVGHGNLTASEGFTALAKIAVGDFNNDGYTNEIAVLTNAWNGWRYYLSVFQVNWKGTAIEVTTMVNGKEIYSHELYSQNTRRDLWFCKPVGDIAIADFNGDGLNEIAVIYKGHNEDLPSGVADKDLNNAFGPVYVKLYQYNTANANERLTEGQAVKYSFDSVGSYVDRKQVMYGVGDLKAVAADVDGDGKYELAMLRVGWAAEYQYNMIIPRDTITYGQWKSYLHIWRHDQKMQMKYDKQIAEFDVLYNSLNTFRTRYLYDDGSTREKTTSNTFTDQSTRPKYL
ncbi:MAG: hypothetical protein IJJ09_04620 [Synergistaceae bacterium]|nr:hypothetical protein [Synergistaceae bacterium]